MSSEREFTERVLKASAQLGMLFDVAKSTWLRDFHFDISSEDWLKKSDARYGIQKYVDFLLRLMEIEYYYQSLAQKRAELVLRKLSI